MTGTGNDMTSFKHIKRIVQFMPILPYEALTAYRPAAGSATTYRPRKTLVKKKVVVRMQVVPIFKEVGCETAVQSSTVFRISDIVATTCEIVDA